jgi:hypothetical protein
MNPESGVLNRFLDPTQEQQMRLFSGCLAGVTKWSYSGFIVAGRPNN